MRPRGRAFGLVIVALLVGAGCRPRPDMPALPPAVHAGMGPAFVARQVVVAAHAGRRDSLHAVLQYDGQALVLVGLTPMQTKAFSFAQRGREIEVAGAMAIPVPPAAVLLDIHRAYFERPTCPRADGWTRRRTPSGRIDELWGAGMLLERVWGSHRALRRRRPDRVRWRGGLRAEPVTADGTPRVPDVVIEHPMLDLRLEIHTVDVVPLPAKVP
jgi:hypothetical protein